MNTSKTLYSILNALIFFIILAIVLGLLFTMLSITGVSIAAFNNTYGIPVSELNSTHYLFMSLNLLVYFVFVYGLFKLRIASKLFLNNNIYDKELGQSIKLSGKCFVITGVFWWFFDGLSNIHFKEAVSIGVSEKTFVYLFFIVAGLFMMLVSQVLYKAIQLKTENDLTI